MYKRNFIMLSCFLLILFLGACSTSGDSEEESSIKLTEDEDSRADDLEKNEERDTESDDTNNDEEDVATDEQDPQEDNNNSEETDAKVGLKKVYLEKLNEAKNEWDDKEPTDSSTYAQKNLAGAKFDVWDGLLNEVYGVLDRKSTRLNSSHV